MFVGGGGCQGRTAWGGVPGEDSRCGRDGELEAPRETGGETGGTPPPPPSP